MKVELTEAKILLIQALVRLDRTWDADLIQTIEKFLNEIESRKANK